jgi:hypothetical protein
MYKVLSIMALCILFSQESNSSHEKENGRRGVPSSKPIAVPELNTHPYSDDEHSWHGSVMIDYGEEQSSTPTRYLQFQGPCTAPWLLKLYERCLITYFDQLMVEKKLPLSESLKKKLLSCERFSTESARNYQLVGRLPRVLNSILPYRETRVLGFLRSPLTYFCPALDMYNAVEAIRVHYPLGALYLDDLFKPNADKEVTGKLVAEATKKCGGMVSSIELLTLFALHVFEHGGITDFSLAEKDARMLSVSAGLRAPLTILNILKKPEELGNTMEGVDGDVLEHSYMSDDSGNEPAPELFILSEGE